MYSQKLYLSLEVVLSVDLSEKFCFNLVLNAIKTQNAESCLSLVAQVLGREPPWLHYLVTTRQEAG